MSRSLRGSLTWLTIAGAAVGVAAIVTLLVLASMLHSVTKDLSTAIESIRAIKDVRVELLTHHEADSPAARAASSAALLTALDESSRYVQSTEELLQVVELRRAAEAYLRPGADESALVTALRGAQRLSTLNIEQGRHVQARATLVDRMAMLGGILTAFVLLLGLVGFLVWLHRGPFRQMRDLSRAMARFSAGELDARADEVGPRELASMAKTFNANARALVDSNRRQREYVATALHDVRTPLAAIQLAVGYFEDRRPLPPESRIRELVVIIERQLTRINGVIGDVLNATWIDAGAIELLETDLDLRTLTLECVTQFRSLAPQHAFELTVPPSPAWVRGDVRRLEQVLNNLLSNAVKYSPHGSRVRVEIAREGDELVIVVEDQGVGIAPEDRNRVFETFRRSSASHEEARGTSLGLWVSRRIVEAHGGRLELAHSSSDRGATFRIVLPGATVSQVPAPRGLA